MSSPVCVQIELDRIKRLVEVAKGGIFPKVSFSEDMDKMRAEAKKRQEEALSEILGELSFFANL